VQEVITHGVNGTLVDFFDVAGWTQALIKSLAHPEQFQTLRQAARQTALDHYDQRHLLPKMVSFVERHGSKP
jgi:glycosyltransferase involved in cell wall biosynthesis